LSIKKKKIKKRIKSTRIGHPIRFNYEQTPEFNNAKVEESSTDRRERHDVLPVGNFGSKAENSGGLKMSEIIESQMETNRQVLMNYSNRNLHQSATGRRKG
jgi:hypothetical protein